MGGRSDGLRPRSTSPIAINTFSNIEQVRVFCLFGLTYVSCTITPNIHSWGGRVDGLGPISKFPIASKSIFWLIQQPTTVTLVMVGIVTGMKLIATYTFNINSCSPIDGERVDDFL